MEICGKEGVHRYLKYNWSGSDIGYKRYDTHMRTPNDKIHSLGKVVTYFIAMNSPSCGYTINFLADSNSTHVRCRYKFAILNVRLRQNRALCKYL